MYKYNRRRKTGPITILFLVLFSCSIVGLGVLSYLDKGRFWDMLPYFCIPIIALSLILAIFNLVRHSSIGLIFIIFFIIFGIGLVLSSLFGPYSLKREASGSYESKEYNSAISSYELLLYHYPNSRHADEALKNISFAYYYNNQNTEALLSLNEAIGAGIIDPQELQVKQMLSDIYFRLAESHAASKEYDPAADDYQSSVDLLKQVKTGFPDTNEAFIAAYKIPQYLYYASRNYIKSENWEDAIGVLEEIISEYPESDFQKDAVSELEDAYLDLASKLGSRSEYEDAVLWFIKYLETDPTLERNFLLDLKIKQIFEDAPPGLIKEYADSYYSGRAYHEAVFLYTILIEFNPEYLEVTIPPLVNSKIFLAKSFPYNETLQPKRGRYIELEGESLLIFKNDTGFSMASYLKGIGSYIVNIEAGGSAEIQVESGEYELLIEFNTTDLLPFFGNRVYDEKRTYTEAFEIEEQE
ncbi:MAG: tetratricopeptide repeat protein [Actinobacteria bacterium]|nr:tetratricopeptide repeat protein [Actinomycetota bacterium]